MMKKGMTNSEAINNKLTRVVISRSPKANKKLQAVIYHNDGRRKTIHFGSSKHEDYTTYYKRDQTLAAERRENYIKRHKKREDFSSEGVFTAGFLSRFVLWEKPTIDAAVRQLNDRFSGIFFSYK